MPESDQYADQRGHDVAWMTAAEREASDRRSAELDALVRDAGQGHDAAELPWLGDVDRRADDDVEFCDEGDWLDG